MLNSFLPHKPCVKYHDCPAPFCQLGPMNGVLGQMQVLTRFGGGPVGCPSQAQLFGLQDAFGCKCIHTNAASCSPHPQGNIQTHGWYNGELPNIHIHPRHTCLGVREVYGPPRPSGTPPTIVNSNHLLLLAMCLPNGPLLKRGKGGKYRQERRS